LQIICKLTQMHLLILADVRQLEGLRNRLLAVISTKLAALLAQLRRLRADSCGRVAAIAYPA
jgi:hypothetical protein